MLRKHLSVLYGLTLFVASSVMPADILAQTNTGIHTFATSSVLAEGRWVRISISETGIYQITDAELRKMGFTDPSKVGVYGFGGELLDEAFSKPHIDDLPEVAVYRDNAKQRILFYGRGVTKWRLASGRYVHRNNPYSKQGYYFLHQKEEAPRAIESVASATENPSQFTTVFTDYALHEVDATSLANTGRELYGESFLYTRSQTFPFDIPGITSDAATVEVDFAVNTPDGGCTLTGSIQGTEFLSATMPKGAGKYVAAQGQFFTKSWTPTGEDCNVTLVYKPSTNNTKVAMLNYIRLNMTRTLGLYDGYTCFRNAKATAYRFDNNPYSERLKIWSLDNPEQPVEITPFNSEGKLAFSRLTAGGEHVILNLDSTFPSVTKEGEVANQNLHGLPQTDMVIIVQPKLQAQAERLAEYRRTHDNLHVTVVTPQQIYNEFSSGTPDATAYRLFMKMFYDRAAEQGKAPSYLLLFGDGAVDNRGMESAKWKPSILENCLLTYQSDPSLVETESYVCDDYFGFLDDTEGGKTDSKGQYTLTSDKLDLGIGRLPVRTEAEAKGVVNKIIAYSDNKVTGNWKNNLCFLGDDGDNNIHMAHAEKMVDLIQSGGHHEFLFTKIYLDAYVREMSASGTSYPVAKKLFFDQLQQGALVVNYSGHGATTSITHEKLFMLSDAQNIIMKRLPVWITATCDFSRFDDYNTSAGEALLLNPNGGAAAMFTTTRVVYSDGNLSLNRELINNLFIKHADGTRYRMGDVMKLAKRALGSQVNKLNFVLLGDPSMTMAYPEYRMEITEVNGEPVTNTPITMKALSRMTMKGRVLELGTTETATDFNGLVYPTIYDSEEPVTTMDNANEGNPFVFNNRTRRLFSSCDSIRGGEFEFSFIVPKDISYSMKPGMLNLYAQGSEGREAQGYFNGYVVGGTVDEMENDAVGPQITTLYLNNDSFKEGMVVNNTPYLFAELEDETGINTTGASVGHDLMIVLRNEKGATLRYVLNDYFLTASGEPGKGTVGFSIPTLEDGKYTLELKAWDVYNNSNTRSISFEVKSTAKPVIFDLRSTQNPVREEVSFLLTHDRPETAVKARIQVYTQMGQCVWDYEVNAMSEFMSSLPVTWDLRTSTGERLQPGIYIYRALLSGDGQHYATKSKKLIVLAQ